MYRIAIYLIISIIMIIPLNSFAQVYVLHTYDSMDSISYFISAKVISLDETEVIASIRLPISGTIINKQPIKVEVGNEELFICFAINGWRGKNAYFSGNDEVLNYCVYLLNDHSIQIIHTDSLQNIFFESLNQFQGEVGFRLSIKNAMYHNYLFEPGLYTLDNNFNICLIEEIEQLDIQRGSIEQLQEYRNLNVMPNTNDYHLFTTFYNSQYWLLKLNSSNNYVVDSLQLRLSGGQATIFGYHPHRNKFYCIHTNYEIHGDIVNKSRNDYHIEPDVMIYNPITLDLVERHTINDYPDDNYPGKENGLAYIEGDYLVYYFFKDDWWQIYAPAMLFIFDTRTNESSWLRVGWR